MSPPIDRRRSERLPDPGLNFVVTLDDRGQPSQLEGDVRTIVLLDRTPEGCAVLHAESVDLTGPVGIVLHVDGDWHSSLAMPAYSMAASPGLLRTGLCFEPTDRRTQADLIERVRAAVSVAADAFAA